MKRCTKCGETKEASEFYAAKGGKDGLRGDCKACHAARAKLWYAKNRRHAIERAARWQRDNAERVRAYRRERNATRTREIREGHLRRTFGMTIADYDAMLDAQGGGCAICGERPGPGESFHVDHLGDQVRGILCVRCNNALGQLRVDRARRDRPGLSGVWWVRELRRLRPQAAQLRPDAGARAGCRVGSPP